MEESRVEEDQPCRILVQEPVDTPESSAGGEVVLQAYRLTVAYDGTNYFGWQRQPDQPTVQEELEKALWAATGDASIKAYGSSRTDTGVHALGQSVLIRTAAWRAAADKLPFALNTKLPADIVVRDAVPVPLGFHPLRDNDGKRYRYQVYNSRKGDPIGSRTHWWVRRRLSLERMQSAAARIRGRQDFYSFQSAGSPRSSTVRDVRRLEISDRPHMDGTLYTIEIEADGFLYNMVRNIVGTLVKVGTGQESPQWVSDVIAARDRRLAGATAPPQGLFLVEVLYE